MFAEMTMLRKLMFLKAASGGNVVEDTATGNPVTFLTDIARPMKSLIANFLPVQEGSGDPAPDNVRPITGWTGLDVWHGGKNLIDDTKRYQSGVTTLYIGATDNERNLFFKAGKYTITRDFNGETIGLYYIKRGSSSEKTIFSVSATEITKTITITEDGYYAVFCYRSSASGGVSTSYIKSLMIEYGETATAYEPYQPITKYPVTWSDKGSVAGGYIDLISGEVWATWAGIKKKWSEGDSATDMGSGITRKVFNMVDNLQTGQAKNLCNVAPYSANENANTHFYYSGIGATNRKVRVFLPTETDGDTDIIVITNVSVPILVTTLTPEQITALVGNNTIWSDANGDVEVTFLKKG